MNDQNNGGAVIPPNKDFNIPNVFQQQDAVNNDLNKSDTPSTDIPQQNSSEGTEEVSAGVWNTVQNTLQNEGNSNNQIPDSVEPYNIAKEGNPQEEVKVEPKEEVNKTPENNISIDKNPYDFVLENSNPFLTKDNPSSDMNSMNNPNVITGNSTQTNTIPQDNNLSQPSQVGLGNNPYNQSGQNLNNNTDGSTLQSQQGVPGYSQDPAVPGAGFNNSNPNPNQTIPSNNGFDPNNIGVKQNNTSFPQDKGNIHDPFESQNLNNNISQGQQNNFVNNNFDQNGIPTQNVSQPQMASDIADNRSEDLLNVLSYVLFLNIFMVIIAFLKKDNFLRFNSIQGFVFDLVFLVLFLLIRYLQQLFTTISIIFLILQVILFISWILLSIFFMYKAYNGDKYSFSFFGKIAKAFD
jgi:uncharacterized membrane protein